MCLDKAGLPARAVNLGRSTHLVFAASNSSPTPGGGLHGGVSFMPTACCQEALDCDLLATALALHLGDSGGVGILCAFAFAAGMLNATLKATNRSLAVVSRVTEAGNCPVLRSTAFKQWRNCKQWRTPEGFELHVGFTLWVNFSWKLKLRML